MFADGLGVPEIVMALENPIDQTLRRRAPDLLDLDRPQIGERGLDEGLVEVRNSLQGAMGQRIVGPTSRRREFDVTGAMKLKHQAATHHVPHRTVGLAPVPGLAQQLGQRSTTCLGMAADQLGDEISVGLADIPAAVRQ